MSTFKKLDAFIELIKPKEQIAIAGTSKEVLNFFQESPEQIQNISTIRLFPEETFRPKNNELCEVLEELKDLKHLVQQLNQQLQETKTINN